MTQSTIGEVAFVESFQHPVVKQVELWIEETVVRFERRTKQATFLLQSCFQGRPRVRQHAAEAGDGPTITDEGFEEVDIVTNHLETGVRIQQHESEIERQPQPFQDSARLKVLLRLDSLAHVNEALRISVLHAHVYVSKASVDQALHTVFLDLIGAATNLVNQFSLHSFFHQTICNPARPLARSLTTGQKVVILKEKNRDPALVVNRADLFNYRVGFTQSTQWSFLCFVEGPDAAKAAVPGTATATEDARGRKLMRLIVDVFSIGPGQCVQVLD